MADFQVRRAVMEDLAAVVALDRATAMLPHWAQSQYKAVFTRPDRGVRRCLFVAEMAGELVGFSAGMVVVAGNDVIAELESVAVSVASRRMGVAKALCGAVIGWARESGAREMELEVRSASEGADRLYEGLGFVVVGRRMRYYKNPEDDAVLMRAELKDGDRSQD